MRYQSKSTGFSAHLLLARYALFAILSLCFAIWLLGLSARFLSSSVVDGAIDSENNAVTISLRGEPPHLDYGRIGHAVNSTIQFHVMEGLLAYDERMELIPGVAERHEIREDGATFRLREDARWSNGEPVTAHDFVFAWRRVQDPATASAYAFIMYPVKNAEAINRGELPPDALGARAVGDRILEVEFERPTPHFDKLVTYSTFYPVNEEFLASTNDSFGSSAESLLYNGPYQMTEWVRNTSMRWDRNPHYWGDHKGRLDTIHIGYITDNPGTLLNLFKDGRIAETRLSPQMLGEAMRKRWRIERSMDGSLHVLQFNFREGRLTANRNFRKALALAQDPAEFVYKALREPGFQPAIGIFPRWVRGLDDYFHREYPLTSHERDLAKAREHLEMARRELGLEEFPPLSMLVYDDSVGAVLGEYYQEVFSRNLGLDVRIDSQIMQSMLAFKEAGNFDLAQGGSVPDYDDALTFGDLYTSWSMLNYGRYSSPEMDRLARIAQSEFDPVIRMRTFSEIQQLARDDVVVLPIFERGWTYVVDPRLKGFKRRALGLEVDLTYAWIDEQAYR